MEIISRFIFLFPWITAVLGASRPECFPLSPACLRPQTPECRAALMMMRHTDPGYVTFFGRHIQYRRNTIDVPRVWQSFPKNCVVKLDVIIPGATDSFRLQHLTVQGEEIIAACITGGTHCGGIINVGPKMVMQLQVGYYAAIAPGYLTRPSAANISITDQPGPVAMNHSASVDEATA